MMTKSKRWPPPPSRFNGFNIFNDLTPLSALLDLRRHCDESRSELVIETFQHDTLDLSITLRRNGEPTNLPFRYHVRNVFRTGDFDDAIVIGEFLSVSKNGFFDHTVDVMKLRFDGGNIVRLGRAIR